MNDEVPSAMANPQRQWSSHWYSEAPDRNYGISENENVPASRNEAEGHSQWNSWTNPNWHAQDTPSMAASTTASTKSSTTASWGRRTTYYDDPNICWPSPRSSNSSVSKSQKNGNSKKVTNKMPKAYPGALQANSSIPTESWNRSCDEPDPKMNRFKSYYRQSPKQVDEWRQTEASKHGAPRLTPTTLAGMPKTSVPVSECGIASWHAASLQQARNTVVAGLQKLIQNEQSLRGCWCVRAFGSTESGFDTSNSDLDLVVYRTDKDDRIQAKQVLGQLRKALRKVGWITLTEAIFGARVPILKMKYRGDLEVDLSACNIYPLRNTQLLKSYASISAQVVDIVVFVKMWAKHEEVSGAAFGHLSPYAWTLLVIYFLQIQLGLPCLCVNSFGKIPSSTDSPPMHEDTQQVPEWTCHLPPIAILNNFFEFYTRNFDWENEVASIRIGRRSQTHEFPTLKASIYGNIEDPIQTERNLTCALRSRALHARLNDRLSQAHLRLEKGQMLDIPFVFPVG